MPYVTTDANAVLNLYKDGKIATAPLSAETLDDALEHRWKINRFNDGSVFYIEFNHRPGRVTDERESAHGACSSCPTPANSSTR